MDGTCTASSHRGAKLLPVVGWLIRVASQACNHCSHTGPLSIRRPPSFSIVLCCYSPEIINNSVFELVYPLLLTCAGLP